ncbi:hypothetical protein [Fluviispira multicolorata]|uniref:Uncharacterized protein n=1 Tax=Fluviispira multicolorata TaxID=2654512 RepID=A0A833JAZ9_9BACT|nr:hypothetical protein [Fluviispira multicolorata]KAB8027963.1 hypothetical protein GCL57_12985 [Fluviispira multicolorata]
MKSLFLFYTQGEAGAPHYLSRTGEQGAETLTETIFSFLTESLHLDLKSTLDERINSLNEDVKWRSFKDKSLFLEAVKTSVNLFSELIIISGSDDRTLKTTEFLAKKLALPACVDERIDRHSLLKPELGTLQEALTDFTQHLNEDLNPALVLVGTSLNALLEWVKMQVPNNTHEDFEKILKMSSENDIIPSVLIAGFEKEGENIRWILDMPNNA